MIKVTQKVDFTGKTVQVGMDVHLRQWNISIFVEGEFIRTFQQPPMADVLIQHLQSHYRNATFRLAYEAGFCGFGICRALKAAGMDCIVVHAADVPQTHKSTVTKNDSNDSRRIGEALCGGMLHAIHIPDMEMESDRSIVRYRQQLMRDITRCRVRIKSMLRYHSIEIPKQFSNANWSNLFMDWLKAINFPHEYTGKTLSFMIEQMEILKSKQSAVLKDINDLQNSDKYVRLNQLLCSIPGIGNITAASLITEIGDIKRFKNFYRFNSFIGFCPSEFSSGDDVRKGAIMPRHHHTLRYMLIEAAWTATRTDPAISLAYQQWKVKHGGKRAIIKIARKLLSRIYYVWTKQQPYEKGIVQ